MGGFLTPGRLPMHPLPLAHPHPAPSLPVHPWRLPARARALTPLSLHLPLLALRCVYQKEDDKGTVGVHLSKELMRIAGHALKVGPGAGWLAGQGRSLRGCLCSLYAA